MKFCISNLTSQTEPFPIKTFKLSKLNLEFAVLIKSESKPIVEYEYKSIFKEASDPRN